MGCDRGCVDCIEAARHVGERMGRGRVRMRRRAGTEGRYVRAKQKTYAADEQVRGDERIGIDQEL